MFPGLNGKAAAVMAAPYFCDSVRWIVGSVNQAMSAKHGVDIIQPRSLPGSLEL